MTIIKPYPGVIETYNSLSEHDTGKTSLPDGVINIISKYKKEKYVLPFVNWFLKEFNVNLIDSAQSNGEKDNHAFRLARWLRTVGNFHQQFLNISTHENITIYTLFRRSYCC